MKVGKPLTRQRSPWVEIFPAGAALGVPTARFFERNVHDGFLRSIVDEEPWGWHLSISHSKPSGEPGRYPTWDEISHARYELLPGDLDFVMHLPPASEYVAVHDTCFHLHENPERVPA